MAHFYLIYIKLKTNYIGIKQMFDIPNLLIYISINKNILLKNKLNRNAIIITNQLKYNNYHENIIEIIIKNITFKKIYYIIKIIATAIFHSSLI